MADIKISQLPVATSVTTTDIVVLNQGGDTKTASLSLVRGAGAGGTVTSITAGTGLNGGTITSSGTVDVKYGTTSGTAAQGNDSRLSNSRTPTAHASTHAVGGSDELTPASIGAASTTQLASYVPTTRSVSSGTGMTGGGDLTGDRTLSVVFGTVSGTVTEGDDSRLSNSRTPTAHAASHAAGASDAITPASIGAVSTTQLAGLATTAQLAGYVPTSRLVSAGTGLSGGGELNADRTISLANVGTAGTYGSSSSVPVITTNAQGQVSSVTSSSIAIAGSQVSGNISGNAGNVTGTVAVANGGTGATGATNARTNLSAAKSGANTDITSVALTTGTISTTPASAADICNKAYADSIASGVNFHEACDYATIAALSPAASYNQPGGAGVGVDATLTGTTNVALDVDGTTVSAGQRILVKNQSSQIENGIYTVTRQGDGSTLPYILTRATDYDTSGSAPNEVQAGDFVLVLNGSIANTAWVQQTPAPVVFGSSNLVFIQFAAASTAYFAGTGLSLSSNTFSITTTGVSALTAGSASVIPVITTNTQGQITNLTTAQVTAAGIGAVATADLTQLAVAGKVPQLDGSGLISTTQIPALTSAQIAQITPSVIGAVATSDLTQLAIAGKVPQLDGSGFLSTAQLADIAGLPVGAVGSSTVVPVITTDSKGRITNLTTAQITGGGSGTSQVASFSAGTTGFTPSTATTGAVTLAGTLNIANGGTGATSQIAALNALAGSVTSGQYLRGNGTNVSMSSLQSSDLSGTIAIANGGTGASTQQGALNAISGSQTAGYHFRSDGTNVSLQPMTVADVTAGTLAVQHGGTGATSQAAALTSLGAAPLADVMHRYVEYAAFAIVIGTMNTGVTPNTFTITATGTYPPDGTMVSVGDTVLFTAQTGVTIQNGPWVCTTAGAVGVSAVFQRPSWFSGTARNGIYCTVKAGISRNGYTYAFVGPVGSEINVGTSTVTAVTVNQRVSNVGSAANTFSGKQTFAVNSATVNPASFSATTTGIALLTTQQLGALEWDTTQMYITNSTQLAGLTRSPIATAQALINAQVGTTYTIALTDAGYLVTLNNAAAVAVSIPTDASVAFPIGTQILLMQLGAGQVTVAAVTPGTTAVNSKNGTKTAGQYAIVSLIKVAANSWVVAGDATV